MAAGAVVDQDAGWQDLRVQPSDTSSPDSVLGWAAWGVWQILRAATWLALLVTGFVRQNLLASAPVLAAGGVLLVGFPAGALTTFMLGSSALGVFWWADPERYDRWVATGWRQWVRRRRYCTHWLDLMVADRLVVRDRQRRERVPSIARIKQGRYADVLKVRLPDGITRDDLARVIPSITEAMRARETRMIPAPGVRLPQWIRSRSSREYARGEVRPGKVYLRLAFGDPLVHTVSSGVTAPSGELDFTRVPIGRRDDGSDWRVSLLGTHVLLAGATGAGKGSVLWSIIAGIGPAIRSGTAQVVGLDPKGGMELAFGRELFTDLRTMDGRGAEEDAVEFLEDLADEADRRAALLAGKARSFTPTVDLPFLLIVIDELASVTAFLSDSKRRQRADAALGRLLTKGRAPGMCVFGALQDPRKEVVKWRDLFPTRIALRLVEPSQIDLVLGNGARERGAACTAISQTMPGVGYELDEATASLTRARAAYWTDADIRELAQTYQPQRVQATAERLTVVDGDAAA